MTNVFNTGAITVAESRLRLRTIVRLRWLGVIGQLVAVCFVAFLLEFELPLAAAFAIIAVTAWVNVYLRIRFPSRHRLSVGFATGLLAFDIIELGALLYLTGGLNNPFTMLLVVPVTVSAAMLPLFNTVGLGLLALATSFYIANHHLPLPWSPPGSVELPWLYRIGVFAAVASCMPFLALYVWRLTRESVEMAAALSATELVLAREQKLHALDGLAAAAAHELGTPLSTITLVTNELARQLPEDSQQREDVLLLRSQAQRCREILQKFTQRPPDEDPLHATLTVNEMMHEAAAPYFDGPAQIEIVAAASEGARGGGARAPVAMRRPGVIFGLSNIVENAADFAETKVDIRAEWDEHNVWVEVIDDGPGFPQEIIDSLGEPYVTSRAGLNRKPKNGRKVGGMGLGFFIAKTLLERSGGRLDLDNRPLPETGAIVRVSWSRTAFEERIQQDAAANALAQRSASAIFMHEGPHADPL